MTVVSRIQLHCANDACKAYFPEEGALDGAIFTHSDLRLAARNRRGWARRVDAQGVLVDVCPTCDAAGFPPRDGGR